MSGALSIPFILLAFVFGGSARVWFAVLGYVALCALVIIQARKNYQLTEKQREIKPLKIDVVPPKEPIQARDSICELSVQNPNQSVDGIRLKLVGLTPPLKHWTNLGFSTEQLCLTALVFSPKDFLNETLNSGEIGHVDIFKVSKVITVNSVDEIILEFFGPIPVDALRRVNRLFFVPELVSGNLVEGEVFRQYILTFSASAKGIPIAETHFRLSFSSDEQTPAFTLTPI